MPSASPPAEQSLSLHRHRAYPVKAQTDRNFSNPGKRENELRQEGTGKCGRNEPPCFSRIFSSLDSGHGQEGRNSPYEGALALSSVRSADTSCGSPETGKGRLQSSTIGRSRPRGDSHLRQLWSSLFFARLANPSPLGFASKRAVVEEQPQSRSGRRGLPESEPSQTQKWRANLTLPTAGHSLIALAPNRSARFTTPVHAVPSDGRHGRCE